MVSQYFKCNIVIVCFIYVPSYNLLCICHNSIVRGTWKVTWRGTWKGTWRGTHWGTWRGTRKGT